MSRMFQIVRRLEKLEQLVEPEDRETKGSPIDYDLLTPREQELEDIIHMVHDVAVRLGYGTYSACRYHFNRGCSPWVNPEVFAKCMEAFTDEERRRYELSEEIARKCIRLTAVLTGEEKELVKEYGHMVIFLRYGWRGRFMDCRAPDYTVEEFEEAKQLYSQIMAKYGEKNYDVEDH